MLVGRRVATLPLVWVPALVGVAARVLVAALVGVAALILVAALFGVAALILVAALVGVARRRVSGLGRVAASFRRIRTGSALRTRATARIVLWTRVAFVVVVVGPPLPLTAAVARIVSHRWYSWFCAKRVVRLWLGGIGDCRAGLDIGVDSPAGAELASMQVRRLLEPDDHITIRLPPLFLDIVRQVLSKSARREVRVGAQLLRVVHTEGNDVFVGCQKAISLERPQAIGRFAAQQGFHLLRHDRSPEHPGKRIPNGRLEFALDALNQPFLANHLSALASLCLVHRRRKATDSPACRVNKACYRDTVTLRHRENAENCIETVQRPLRA